MITKQAWIHESAPPGVEKLVYRGIADGVRDWALAWRPPGGEAGSWVVVLHGHGSSGDQIFTRLDISSPWLSCFRKLGLGVLAPNLRGNAWMSPEAVEDLHRLLEWVRNEYRVRSFFWVSGSMGGTGNLVYAVRYPGDVAALAALCPATDIAVYHAWCCAHPGGVRDEIRLAIESSYGGRPDQVPGRYAAHSVVRQAGRLTMPLFVAHATGDDVIPVEQSRALVGCLAGSRDMTYVEIEGGGHDAPLQVVGGMLEWLDEQVK